MAFLAAVAVSAGLAGAPADAQTAIKVIVNGKPITTYDIDQRARLVRLTSGQGGAQATRAAREELIDEQLKLGEAARLGIRVSEAEVDDAYASIASRVRLSTAQLTQALRQSGISPDTLRNRLQAEIGWNRILSARFQSEVTISEAEIIAALQRDQEKAKSTSKEYSVRSVVFVVPGKSSNAQRAQRKREAEQFRSRLEGCDQAEALAQEYREVVVMPIRTRLETEVPTEIRDQLDKTAIGKATAPQQANNGFELLALCNKREIASNAAARMEVEDQLRNREGEQMTRRLLRELRSRAIIDYR